MVYDRLISLPAAPAYTTRSPDNVNTVERIELSTLRANDLITFVVHGRDIRHRLLTTPDAQLPQRWAVVVAGHFNGTLRSQYNPTYTTPNRLAASPTPVRPFGLQRSSDLQCVLVAEWMSHIEMVFCLRELHRQLATDAHTFAVSCILHCTALLTRFANALTGRP